MKVKTYKYRSLQEGLQSIKQDLGSDALILSTRAVSVRPRFGLFKRNAWEITAAAQDKRTSPLVAPTLPLSPPAPGPHAHGAQSQAKAAAAAAAAIGPAAAPARDQRMDTLIDEITELKKSFRTLSRVIPGKSDSAGGIFAELVGNGLDHEMADHFIAAASQDSPAPTQLRERIRRLIAAQLVIAPAAELHAKARVVTAFVGSTGVGKTTTIAKIAGHASIRMKKKVALISTDTFRIGGQDQLMRFGQLLGIPTYGCADVSTLKDLVDSLDDRDLILIDTPGSSPSDLARLSKLEAVTSAAGAKVHLVISAATRSEDITKIVIRFQRFRPNSVIFTKIDETDCKGPLTGDLLRNELPVSYVTNGQRVPEDLIIPTADELARHVLPLEPAI